MIKKIIIVKDKDHLEKLIKKEIKKNGYNCDLNHLDVSNVKDMGYMFYSSCFNGDISNWDVSNVENMSYMFYESKFTGDISKWNTSKVKYMSHLFVFSKFNGDISNWDVGNVKNMSNMFYKSEFNNDISRWNVSNAITTNYMFFDSKFERYEDLNNWKPYSLQYNNIFNNEEKNKKVYWSDEYINLNKKEIKLYIDIFWAEQEKQLLTDNNKNKNNLISKKNIFKI